MARSNISSARRTSCMLCRVPSMRRPRRACLDCGKMVCVYCNKICCDPAKARAEKLAARKRKAGANPVCVSCSGTGTVRETGLRCDPCGGTGMPRKGDAD